MGYNSVHVVMPVEGATQGLPDIERPDVYTGYFYVQAHTKVSVP